MRVVLYYIMLFVVRDRWANASARAGGCVWKCEWRNPEDRGGSAEWPSLGMVAQLVV